MEVVCFDSDGSPILERVHLAKMLMGELTQYTYLGKREEHFVTLKIDIKKNT